MLFVLESAESATLVVVQLVVVVAEFATAVVVMLGFAVVWAGEPLALVSTLKRLFLSLLP